MKINKLITHDNAFHSDDVFAAAALTMLLEKKGENFEIIRTRDEEIIKSGDFVFDVGGVYDPELNRFDHHQTGGAGRRAFGDIEIEYSSFGLIWKKFGAEISSSQKIADILEKRLVAPIDAWDNAIDLVQNTHDITPYFIQNFIGSMHPTWREDVPYDALFFESLPFARKVLEREILHATDGVMAEEAVLDIYHKTEDKRIIVLDKHYPFEFTLSQFPEPMYVLYPRPSGGLWGVKAARSNPKTFINKKDLPKAWAGLRDRELEKVTGVPGAVFCHRALFLAVAKTKEGAIQLAQQALAS